MASLARSANALGWSVSVIALSIAYSATASAQQTTQPATAAQPLARAATKQQSPKPRAARQNAAAQNTSEPSRSPLDANAQAGQPASQQSLDAITTSASKTEEKAIDALAPVSVVSGQEIAARQPTRVGDIIYNIPGVWTQDRGDDPSTSINIRGLQDFGRVAYIVDGARQNYQRTGHFANGSFYLNPEFIAGVDIVRGPTANIYGSGAIGGVASFRTKDIQDVVRPGERWGVDANTVLGTNKNRALGSVFGGVHVSPNFDIFAGATYAVQDNYKDGTGYEVGNTGNKLSGAIGKITFRPADGHEVKIGHTYQENIFNVGQFPRLAGAPNTTGTTVNGGTSIYHSNVRNFTTTAGWKYSRPDDYVWDFDAKVYWNKTENDQRKTAHTSASSFFCPPGVPGNGISGCIGSVRGYELNTLGFDVFNTSRADAGDWRHAFTYGVDGFQDRVVSTDRDGTQDATTPGGKRDVFGAFGQWKVNYGSWIEAISAIRFDDYELTSPAGGSKGSRFSPKITVGFMPQAIVTPYVSYAEGYRAPSISETLISGAHASATPFDAFFVCPSGQNLPGPPGTNNALFCFLPNPGLRPEVGKNKEIGINLKKNDLFTSGDSIRGKFNVFRNDVTNYIDMVSFSTAAAPPFAGQNPFFQYQNIAAVRIEGFEAETTYDANLWYVGVSGSILRGVNTQTGVGIYSIPGHKITTNAGLRFLDGKLVVSAMWTHIAQNRSIPATFLPATTYEMVNLYLTAKPTQDVTVNLSVENLLNQYYRPYPVPTGSDSTSTQNDVKWASAGPGIVFKGGLKVHFGGS
jgi:hemoglobin/transferrin/lactoferrin receptor protein